MLALRTTAVAPHGAMVQVAEPVPLPNEALVGVRGFSLNRGEVLDLASAAEGVLGVGFQNPNVRRELRVHAAGWYSFSSPPRAVRRVIRWVGRPGIGSSGRGGRSCRDRCGRWPL